MGFWYTTRKNYYIYNNKKDTTIEYRWNCLNIYVDYERQSYLWVHLTLDEAQKYFADLPGIKEPGYSYVDTGKEVNMVEFHIDNCEYYIYIIKGTHYGGFLSFRFPEGQRPVMNIGHD